MTTDIRRPPRRRPLFAALVLAAAAPLMLHALSPADAPVLRFVIEDGHDVESDGLGEYVDFRLVSPGDTTNINYCVESQVSSITFLFFNRDLDALGGAGTDSCEGTAPVARRQYSLHIESSAACAELMANNYAWSDGATGCFLNGYRNPRIRIDKLFASRPRTTPIDFLIGRNVEVNPPEAPTYRIESDREAAISVSGDTRTIEYGFSSSQTFTLVKVGTKIKGGSTPSWALPFTMTLRMSFTVETVTP
jgi:hypothetical protein